MTLIYIVLALLCFASNSIICRLALSNGSINPIEFTTIRLLSGVFILTLVTKTGKGRNQDFQLRYFLSAGTLFLYMISFSFAYVNLNTSTGALLLFGAVQGTMIIFGFIQGMKIKLLDIVGLLIALLGLIYFFISGWETPTLKGGILMIIAGVSWGIYSIIGGKESNPILATKRNFSYAIPFAFVSILFINGLNITFSGGLYATISGAITSGLGYLVWYTALRSLKVTQAAVIQLSVPIITAIGGVIFLSEIMSLRLILSSIMILGGVGVCFLVRKD